MVRDVRIDFAKGVLITLVVLGHTSPIGSIEQYWQTISNWLYSIHVPAFMFISGLLFDAKNHDASDCKKVVSRLVLPYATVGTVFSLLYCISKKITIGQQLVNFAIGLAGGALWYLYFLAIFEIILLCALSQFRQGKTVVSYLMMVLAFMVITAIANAGLIYIKMPWFFFLFLLGYLMKKSPLPMVTGLWMIPIPIIMYLVLPCRNRDVVQVVYVLTSYLALLALGDLACKYRLGRGIAFLGVHSLSIMMFHPFITNSFKGLQLRLVNYDNIGAIGIVAVTSAAILISILIEYISRIVKLNKILGFR